jgi:hypothetical protein
MEVMFYVYCYFNPLKPSTLHECGFEPFYVGKGKDDRKIHHLFESKLARDSNKLKKNTISKIRAHGMDPYILTLSEFQDEESAFAEEKRLIKLWGRRDLDLGPLTNMTDGGEGPSNKIVTAETRRKISKAASNVSPSKETRRKISEAGKGKKQSAEHIKKRAEARDGYKHSEETKKKLSEAQQRIRETAEWKAKASAAQKGRKLSPQHIAKMIMNNPRSKPIHLMGVNYPSFNAAVKATGLTPGKVKKHPTFKPI